MLFIIFKSYLIIQYEAEENAYRIYKIGMLIEELEKIVREELKSQTTNRARLEKRAIYIRALEDRIDRVIYKNPSLPKIQQSDILIFGGVRPNGSLDDVTLLGTELEATVPFPEVIPEGGRVAHCAINYEGTTYLLGGAGVNVTTLTISDLEKDGFLTNEIVEWGTAEPMIDYHDYGAGCAVHDSRIWVCGGYDGYNATFTCESYHPEDGWKEEEPILNPVYSTSLVSDGERLLVIGGTDYYGDYGIVQVYQSGNWTYHSVLPNEATKDVSSIAIDGDIYVIGGFENEKSILSYDEDTRSWKEVNTLSRVSGSN